VSVEHALVLLKFSVQTPITFDPRLDPQNCAPQLQSPAVVQGVAQVPLSSATWPELQQMPLLQFPEQQSVLPLQWPPLEVQVLAQMPFRQT
jgi:hypothetical protein